MKDVQPYTHIHLYIICIFFMFPGLNLSNKKPCSLQTNKSYTMKKSHQLIDSTLKKELYVLSSHNTSPFQLFKGLCWSNLQFILYILGNIVPESVDNFAT